MLYQHRLLLCLSVFTGYRLSAQPPLWGAARWATFQSSRFAAGVLTGKGLSKLLASYKQSPAINNFISKIQGPPRMAAETVRKKVFPTAVKLVTASYLPGGLGVATDFLPEQLSWFKSARQGVPSDGRIAFVLGLAAGPLLKLIAYQYALPGPFAGWGKPL